jgi:rhodanese-related sulfurtransferase
MKRWLYAVMAGLTIVMLGACASLDTGGSLRISKEEAESLMGKPGVDIIDVRVGRAYSGSHWKIKGAVRENPIDVKTWAHKYPKTDTILLYCS